MQKLGFWIRRNWLLLFTLSFFTAFSVWWVSIYLGGQTEATENNAFNLTYSLISLFGGIVGLVIAKQWGGFKSVLGRALGAFALGLLGQAFGQFAYSYYIYILGVDLTDLYPSLGDFGFFATAPLYAYGMIQLARAMGVKVSLRSYTNRASAIIIPILFAIASYIIFLNGYEYDWSNPLAVILDLGSPIIDAVYLSLAILAYFLSRNFLGGLMKAPVLLLLVAVVMEAISDFTFLYLDAHMDYLIYAANFSDYMYLTTYTLMTITFIWLGDKFRKIKES